MIDQPNQNQLNNQQKYFICFECCFWAYQIIVIALGLTIMAFVIFGYSNTKTVLGSDQYSHAQETVWLWKQGYIIDIRAENTNNCPQGYTPLITYSWPGTVTGCSCSGGSNGYNFDFVLVVPSHFTKGQCTKNLISMGCKIVSPMNAETLNMWKGTSLICYKRANSMNFYNSILTTAPSGGTSPYMTACAVNQTYQVYTLPGVTCPISSISNQSLGSAQTQLSLDTTNNYFMNFVSGTGYPIANIKLTEYQFCDYFNTTNISPNKAGRYVLEQSSISQPCSKTDPRMVTVDQLDEEGFYTNNTRVYELITSLPSYPKPSVDYKYLLGYVAYPSWTYQCRSSSDYNLYIATDHLLFKTASKSLSITASITIPCILVLIILFRIYFIIRHVVDLKSRKTYNAMMLTQDEIVEQLPNLDIKKSFKKEFILFVLEVLLLFATFGSIVYSIVTTTSDSVWIKQIIRLQCTDTYLQDIFRYYQTMIDKTASILIKATFVWVVLFICHVIYFITRTYIGDLFSKKQPQPEQISSVDLQPLDILNKEGNIQGINMQDSSELALNNNKDSISEIKIYDADYLMGDGGGETKDNFYGLDREASINVVKKKKKKRVTTNKKKKNLFKDDQL